ncbi:MAG: hypothetical protein M3137_10685 [Actinomycetota bacterium]|nr:hypothetical protein [Actinomycetota bacterium]
MRGATAVLRGGESAATMAEIAGPEGDVVSAAIAGEGPRREPVEPVPVAALAAGGWWTAERVSRSICRGRGPRWA